MNNWLTLEEYLKTFGKGEPVKNGDNITVDYIWRLEDGTVFDTSIESVAKENWKYNEARDYTEWLISGLSEWDTVFLWNWYAKVSKITDKEITFDFNHELAGKNLIFDITLKSINN